MTAVAALYEELVPIDAPLIETLVAQLPEQALTTLLERRFRFFLTRGSSETEALLLAVGYTAADAALIAGALAEPAVLH